MGEDGFYTLPEAARLAGVPRTTVAYWATTGLIVPSQSRRRPRLYSFSDLRDLCVAEQLRRKGARVRAIRAALGYVRQADQIEHLTEAGFGVTNGGELVYRATDSTAVRPDRKGQVFWVDLRQAMDQLGAKHGTLEVLRPHERVEIDPGVRGGTPVVAGTRIPTRLVADLADEASVDQVLRDYPSLRVADVKAAVAYETGLGQPKGRRATEAG